MHERKLGGQGLTVSEIGLGCMGMSQSYGTPDDQESLATFDRALELGINFFDTAEVYGPYTNEKLIGKALKGKKRDQIIIATKFGFNIVDGKMKGVNSQPKQIKKVVDESLQRLGLEYIDLLYQHRVDPNVPIEEVADVVSELISQGKVRYFGLSEAGVETIKRAHKVHPVSVLQSEYSLWERNLEDKIIPLLKELDIGLVPFSPLGRGFLTGNIKRSEEYPEGDFRRNDPRFQGKNFDANMKALALIHEMAKSKKATAAQIALAWLLHKGSYIVPIPGTKRRPFLEENVGATKIKLTESEIQKLDNALPPGLTSGPRYNDQHMALVDR